MMAHMQDTEGTASAMVDSAAEVESGRLGDALVELETQGVAYGDLALTIALHGDLAHTERLDGDLLRIFAAHDAKVIREGYGQLPAWFCRLPAQPRKRQVRSVFVSAGVAACLAPIYGPPRGEPRSRHLDRAALAILETQWHTPFYYDLFHGDVGHTLVLGATGAGKSFTLNFLLVQALQYNPRVLILDLGGSYRWLTRFLGGGYMELSPDDADGHGRVSTPTLCLAGVRADAPISHRVGHALASHRRVDRDGRRPVRNPRPHRRPVPLSPGAAHHDRPRQLAPVRDVAGDGALVRRGGVGPVLRQPGGRGRSGPGRLARDRPRGGRRACGTCVRRRSFTCWNVLRLALERPDETARVKLMVVDEAWRYLRDPAVLAYLAEAAKTWRKKNAALIMATQSAVDVTGTIGAEALLESMPTKLFLANPELPAKAADIFRLNDAEVATIRGLVSKQELYLRRPNQAATLRLDVDPESYWLYTSSARDSARRAAAVEQHGLEGALAHLAGVR